MAEKSFSVPKIWRELYRLTQISAEAEDSDFLWERNLECCKYSKVRSTERVLIVKVLFYLVVERDCLFVSFFTKDQKYLIRTWTDVEYRSQWLKIILQNLICKRCASRIFLQVLTAPKKILKTSLVKHWCLLTNIGWKWDNKSWPDKLN